MRGKDKIVRGKDKIDFSGETLIMTPARLECALPVPRVQESEREK